MGAERSTILIESAARTATNDSVAIDRQGCSGLIFIVDVTVAPAETLTPSIQFYSSVTATWTELTAYTGLTATGKYALLAGPAALNGGTSSVQAKNVLIPIVTRLRLAHSAGGSWTYSVELQRVVGF